MKTFRDTFILESKRTLNMKTVVLLFLISVLSLYFVQTGINKYKGIIGTQKSFQDVEYLKAKNYNTYAQYGTYGFQILFIPSPLSVFFVNSSTISELISNVDSGERLNIFNSFKGKTLFAEKSGGFKDFSGIILLLGSLLVIYLGYDSLVPKDYLRFITGFVDYRKFFASVILSRLFILVMFFILNGCLSLILLRLNRIRLSNEEFIHLAAFYGVLILMVLVFYFLGAIAGSFKSSFMGFVTVILSWFALVFLIPGTINTVISEKSDIILPYYQLELQKLKILMDFERSSSHKVGSTNASNLKQVRKMMNEFLDTGFNKILGLEKQLKKDMENSINHYQFLSALFPSTMFLSTSNEVSSKGYESFIRFFNYILDIKMRFVKFYLAHRYYSELPFDTPTDVEPFPKHNENVFKSGTLLPGHFLFGLAMMIVYISALLMLSFYRFKKSLLR